MSFATAGTLIIYTVITYTREMMVHAFVDDISWYIHNWYLFPLFYDFRIAVYFCCLYLQDIGRFKAWRMDAYLWERKYVHRTNVRQTQGENATTRTPMQFTTKKSSTIVIFMYFFFWNKKGSQWHVNVYIVYFPAILNCLALSASKIKYTRNYIGDFVVFSKSLP